MNSGQTTLVRFMYQLFISFDLLPSKRHLILSALTYFYTDCNYSIFLRKITFILKGVVAIIKIRRSSSLLEISTGVQFLVPISLHTRIETSEILCLVVIVFCCEFLFLPKIVLVSVSITTVCIEVSFFNGLPFKPAKPLIRGCFLHAYPVYYFSFFHVYLV